MRALDVIAMSAFLSALIALPFAVFNFRRRPIRSFLIFVAPILVFLGVCDLGRTIGQAQILAELDQVTDECQVSVDGKPSSNPREALSAFKALRWIPKHHSEPTKPVRIEVSDRSRQFEFLIARDSRDPREYWVFYPKSFITKHNDVGQIVTSAFDNGW
jgi:hypothetical protein